MLAIKKSTTTVQSWLQLLSHLHTTTHSSYHVVCYRWLNDGGLGGSGAVIEMNACWRLNLCLYIIISLRPHTTYSLGLYLVQRPSELHLSRQQTTIYFLGMLTIKHKTYSAMNLIQVVHPSIHRTHNLTTFSVKKTLICNLLFELSYHLTNWECLHLSYQ